MLRRIGILSTLAALCACSGAELPGSNNNNNNNTPSCLITITGAATANGACTATLRFSFSDNQTLFTLSLPTTLGTVTAVTTLMVLKSGDAVNGLFSESSAISAEMDVFAGTQSWLASRSVAGLTTQGTISLILTDVGSASVQGNSDKLYSSAHGTLDVTAPFKLGTGASGTSTVHVVF